MLSIRETILHHIKASGPCATDSIVAYLDEQCTDPAWDAVCSQPHEGRGPTEHKARIDASKRDTVRDAMAKLVAAGEASVYSNTPAVCWW